MTDGRAAMLEGLNLFRALEAWGATLYARWAETETDPELRMGHLIIAEREANHARLLAERLRALGAEPGPACVDGVLARQLDELGVLRGFVAQLDGLKAANERDAGELAGSRAALARGFEASKSEIRRPTRSGCGSTARRRSAVAGTARRTPSGAVAGRARWRPGPVSRSGGPARGERPRHSGEPAACIAVG